MQVCSFGARGCRELRHYSGSGRRRVEPPHQRRLLRCDRSLPHHSHRRYCCRGLLLRRRLGGPHRRRRGPLCDHGPFPLLALHLGDWPAWARHLLRRAAAAAPRRSGGCFVLYFGERESPLVSSKLTYVLWPFRGLRLDLARRGRLCFNRLSSGRPSTRTAEASNHRGAAALPYHAELRMKWLVSRRLAL